MWIGVLRPPIVRMTIGRPQAQLADVHTMAHLLVLTPVDPYWDDLDAAIVADQNEGSRAPSSPEGRPVSVRCRTGFGFGRCQLPRWHRSIPVTRSLPPLAFHD